MKRKIMTTALLMLTAIPAKVAFGLPIPTTVELPQICHYQSPHDQWPPVIIERNDVESIKVTHLKDANLNGEGADGDPNAPIILYYKGYLSENRTYLFMKKDSDELPPEVKLPARGGETVFYGSAFGYGVICQVTGD